MRTLEEQMCEAWEEGMYYGTLNNRVLTTDDFSTNICWTDISRVRYLCIYLVAFPVQ